MDYDKHNKENQPLLYYTPRYEALDPEEVCGRCGVGFNKEKSVFTLEFMGRAYEVGFPEFSARVADGKTDYAPLEDMHAAKLLVMRYLIEGRYIETLGKFMTFREMPWGEVYVAQFDGRCIKRLAFGFGSKPELLERAMERLGATRIKMGDIAYELELLPGLKMQFILWQGDDEFPPSSQILFSDNFSVAFTAEDMAVIGDVTIGTLKTLSK